MKLVITYNQYKLLDLLAYRTSLLSDTLKYETDNKNLLSTNKRLFTISEKKVDSAKIPEQVKNLVISIGNNWAKYTSDAFAFFFTFFLLPFAQSLVLAFTDAYGYNKHFHFIGLANFKEALSNRAFLRAIWVTVRYTLFVTLGANVSALVLALLLDSNTHFKKLFRAVFFLPNLMSLIIVGFVWVFLYGNVYRSAVQAFGIPEAYQISWLGSMKLAVYSIGLTAIWQCAGYYMIIYIAGLQNISKDLLEAAAVDGANKWTVITRIKLPLLAPVVVMNVILCLASCFKAFDIPMAMTSGGPAGATTTIALQIYNTGFSSNRTGYATAQSIILFLIISAITAAVYLFQGRKDASNA